MPNMYVKGRYITVQTTKVIGKEAEYEVVGNITYSKFNPNILLCAVGTEHFIITKSALQSLLYRRTGKFSVSIFRTLSQRKGGKGHYAKE